MSIYHHNSVSNMTILNAFYIIVIGSMSACTSDMVYLNFPA